MKSTSFVRRSFRVKFERVAEEAEVGFTYFRFDDTNIQSRLAMPPDFEVTAPRSGEIFDVTEELVLEWSPRDFRAGRAMVIWTTVECRRFDGTLTSRTTRWQVPDEGAFVFDLGSLPEATDDTLDPDVDCSMRFALERDERISLSPPYAAGSLKTSVRRSVDEIVLRL